MNEHDHQDQLDQDAGDQLDVGNQDQLDVQAGDQLEQPADQVDQLSDDQAGDGETTGDQDVSASFDGGPAELDQDELETAATEPHPYSPGFGLAGKFPADNVPGAAGEVRIVQDDQAPADDQGDGQ